MIYPKIIVVILSIIVILTTVYYIIGKRSSSIPPETTMSSSQEIIQSQTNLEGSVTVKVTPKDLYPTSTTWDFEIILDTHSGNLDQNLTKRTLLSDDKGNQSTPISWEGDPPEGHHRQGILKFNPIISKPNSIELKIAKVGNVDERIFKWELR